MHDMTTLFEFHFEALGPVYNFSNFKSNNQMNMHITMSHVEFLLKSCERFIGWKPGKPPTVSHVAMVSD